MQTTTFAPAKKAIKILAVLGALYLTSACAQAVQILVSVSASRSAIITNWKVTKPEQAELVDQFVNECFPSGELVKHDDSELIEQPAKLQTITECGELIGADELAAAIKASDTGLESGIAWPLSSFI